MELELERVATLAAEQTPEKGERQRHSPVLSTVNGSRIGFGPGVTTRRPAIVARPLRRRNPATRH